MTQKMTQKEMRRCEVNPIKKDKLTVYFFHPLQWQKTVFLHLQYILHDHF